MNKTIIFGLLLLTSCIHISLPQKNNSPESRIIDTEGLDTLYNFPPNNNKIFSLNKVFVYDVSQVEISRNFNFKLEMKAIPGEYIIGETKIKYKYYYSIDELLPSEKIKFGYDSLSNQCQWKITSLEETNSGISIHPPRSHSLRKLEKAPFPEVRFSSKNWESKLLIPPFNYRDIKMGNSIIKWNYSVDSITLKDTIPYKYYIHSIAESKKGGRNTLDAVFQVDSGFVKLNYFFEDSTSIDFVLKEIK